MKQIYNIMPIITGICFGSAGIFVRELSENMNMIMSKDEYLL